MRKQVHELRENVRAQATLEGRQRPMNRRTQRRKNFSLRVMCASDYPHRVTKLEDLQLELLQNKLYSNMTPLDICQGEFEVTEGFERQFMEIAKEHGFYASEMIIA